MPNFTTVSYNKWIVVDALFTTYYRKANIKSTIYYIFYVTDKILTFRIR